MDVFQITFFQMINMDFHKLSIKLVHNFNKQTV